MAIPIASTASIADKFASVTPGRAQYYADGVANPRKNWEAETVAAEDRYKDGVIKAANAGRFGKGVKKAGQEKYMRNTLNLGVRRWPEGVQEAKQAYEEGIAVFRDVIANLTLPPRFATGDERNLARVAMVSKALHAKKIAG